jgi:hypothetical protein
MADQAGGQRAGELAPVQRGGVEDDAATRQAGISELAFSSV